jgi:hypothetical protein
LLPAILPPLKRFYFGIVQLHREGSRIPSRLRILVRSSFGFLLES